MVDFESNAYYVETLNVIKFAKWEFDGKDYSQVK